MPTTIPALPELSLFDLATVTGGCGGKQRACNACPPPPQQQPAQQQLPAAAPPSDPAVSTNVSISGYGS